MSLPNDYLGKPIFDFVRESVDEASKPVVRTDIRPVIQFPESTHTKVLAKADYDDMVAELERLQRADEESVGLRFLVETILTLHRRPFPPPVFDLTLDRATRDQQVRELLQSAGLLAPDAAFHFGGGK